MQSSNELDTFFKPRSVCVVGASRTPGKAGNIILENILANGYQGDVYPVNPNVDDVLGLRCYPSVRHLPAAPDLVVIAIPAAGVLATVQECAAQGAKALAITTSGFAEWDAAGARLQEELVRIARDAHMRIVGPNTTGLTSTPDRLAATIFPVGKVPNGSVSIIAQTGNFSGHTLMWMMTVENIGVCRVAGLGNRIDVDEAEVLEYFGNDPETKAIAMYLEGFKNARRFLEVARVVSRRKPLIALKSGRTSSGIRAVGSHTASLAGDDAVVDAALGQAGIVRVQTYASLIDTIKLLSMQAPPRGNRVAILTPSGALGIIAADACERLGLRVGELSADTLGELQALFPSYIRVGNPIDVWGASMVHGTYEAYRRAVRVALADEGIDVVYCVMIVTPGTVFGSHEFDPEALSFIPELARQHPDKVVMMALSGRKDHIEAAKSYLEGLSVPVFVPVEPALEALAHVDRCRQYATAIP